MSVNVPAFSINGTRRIQGFVGQNVISRSLPRTTMKSHGGCCGSFIVQPVVMSSVQSTEDTTVVKRSVIGTQGLIETKYAMPYYKRPFPCSIVKPDATMNMNIQSSYVLNLAQKTLQESANCLYPLLPVAQGIFMNSVSGLYTIEIGYNGVTIFTGIFTVNQNLVTHFYDLINPHNDIYVNNGLEVGDSIFSDSDLHFGPDGTNITTIPYFDHLLGLNNQHYNLYYDTRYNTTGVGIIDRYHNFINSYPCTFSIQYYDNTMLTNFTYYLSNFYGNLAKTAIVFTGCSAQPCQQQLHRSVSAPGKLPKPLQYTKDPSTYTSVSQSQRLLSLDKKCSENDIFTIPIDGIYGKKTSFNYPAGCH